MRDRYENPLCRRYAGREMQEIFSDDRKFSTWRQLWVALAESERELGLPITEEQIEELRAHVTDIDYDIADAREREVRHDVMAHIYAYGKACPSAKPIIHLGATSCYVGDNTDLLLQRDALSLVREKLLGAIGAVWRLADRYADTPTLAYTHFQAAQPTTAGKRACLWMQDLMMDLEHLDRVLGDLRLLGCRGTTGTGASFLELFGGDAEKVEALEAKISEKMGMPSAYAVSGQTYSRKVDYFTLSVLSGIAQSAMKFAGDVRLLSHLKEADEPFETGQVGSSAMAYKRNPMRSERICALARYVIADALNPAMTAGTQWLERTLDDSANRRISIPEAFLAVDGILTLYMNVASGITLYPKVMEKHLREELPFLATENILMHCVRAGGDRQTLHEAIRRHAVAAGRAVKEEGKENDLLDRIAADPAFGLSRKEIDRILKESDLTGLAARQTRAYLDQVQAVLEKNASDLAAPCGGEVRV